LAGFLYFRSGDSRPINRAGVNKLGLGYAFDGSSVEARATSSGSPSGKAGLIFCAASRHEGKTVGYYPEQQTWRKLPRVEGRPELWLGYWNDAKPTPEDLSRASMLPGEVSMNLGGQQWLIATLTEFDDERKDGDCMLPAPLDYDDDGNLVAGKPVGINAELWDAVHPVALGLCFGGDGSGIAEPTAQEIRLAAFSIIGANYVVDMPELVALGALENESTFRNIVMACCRGRWMLDALNDLAKKNEPPQAAAGSDTSDGKAA
jgi:hypothetical protein